MIDASYGKADLLWEATRRNEEYKSLYNQVIGQMDDAESKLKRVWHPGTYRWKIHGLLNPSISIDEIRARIKGGADPNETHPYYYLFESERQGIIWHQVPDIEPGCLNDSTSHSAETETNSSDCIWYQNLRTITQERILVSINPMTSDRVIFEEIKKLKKGSRHILKDELNELKAKGKRTYYPRDIDKYIGWLKKYTEIVDYLGKKFGADRLSASNGVITLPDGFSFFEMVPNDTPGKQFAGVQKANKIAYTEAVILIRSSPHIRFQPHRTQR